jgi:hypothetical protein
MNIKLLSIGQLYEELSDKENKNRFIEFLNGDVQKFIYNCYDLDVF